MLGENYSLSSLKITKSEESHIQKRAITLTSENIEEFIEEVPNKKYLVR